MVTKQSSETVKDARQSILDDPGNAMPLMNDIRSETTYTIGYLLTLVEAVLGKEGSQFKALKSLMQQEMWTHNDRIQQYIYKTLYAEDWMASVKPRVELELEEIK